MRKTPMVMKIGTHDSILPEDILKRLFPVQKANSMLVMGITGVMLIQYHRKNFQNGQALRGFPVCREYWAEILLQLILPGSMQRAPFFHFPAILSEALQNGIDMNG